MRACTLFVALGLVASTPAQAPRTPLVGVVVDPTGQPVPDARIEVFRGEGRGFTCLDLEYRHTWLPLAKTGVDKRGRFGVQLPVGLTLRVQVWHPSFATWRQDDLVAGDDLRIELQPPCTFRGRLVRAGTGEGAAGTLRAWDAQNAELFRGRTEADGSFEFTHLPAGAFTCEVEPDVLMVPAWFRGTLAPGAPLEQRFELELGVLLRGKVTDAATGQPIDGARVGENWTLDKMVRTGRDGVYELRGFGQQGVPNVTCLADGYARLSVDRPKTLVDPMTIDFALHRGVPVAGVVLDPTGQPRASVYVAAISNVGNHMSWLATRTDASGRFLIEGLLPGSSASLMLRCDGFASTVYHLPPADRIDVGELRLQPANVVRGTVCGADGKPVPGARVQLSGANADRQRFAGQPALWTPLSIYLAERQARCDAAGNFTFGDVPAGTYLLGNETKPRQVAPANAVEIVVTAGEPVPQVQVVR